MSAESIFTDLGHDVDVAIEGEVGRAADVEVADVDVGHRCSARVARQRHSRPGRRLSADAAGGNRTDEDCEIEFTDAAS